MQQQASGSGHSLSIALYNTGIRGDDFKTKAGSYVLCMWAKVKFLGLQNI